MNLRRDHVAGGAFVAGGALVLALSNDLPFGTLASPGAGMLPMLIVVLLMALGAVLFARAGESPPLGTISWADLPHAVRVIIVTGVAVAAYTKLGFLVTLAVMLFVLTFFVERRPLLPAAIFSAGVTALAYALFALLLRTPLPRGLLGL